MHTLLRVKQDPAPLHDDILIYIIVAEYHVAKALKEMENTNLVMSVFNAAS